jgi:cytochrome c biogenesis protein CcdA/thiol-disulfide isomerase/thioredoxin
MTFFILSFAAGMLTIASPCILPILPFVLARADRPFVRGGLPLLLGLALAFAAVATLGAVAGGWAVELNRHGRTVALAAMTLFGLAMLLPQLADRLMAPLVALGARLSDHAQARIDNGRASIGASILLGVATGFVWAPCAGPVMGLILAAAALRGPGLETSLLLFTYGLGAATALGAGMLFGRKLLARAPNASRWSDGARRMLGAAVIAGAAVIWLGADTGLLTRLSSASTTALEQRLIVGLRHATGAEAARAGKAASTTSLSPQLQSLLPAQPWLNGQLRESDLRGKVVLVNFWTYSCINCLRALPYVRAWAEKYRDRGLVVVGVHTPEFAFEKHPDNVRKAAASLGVSYPVVLDNDFEIWRAFDNSAWPALYFIGADGRVRHESLGEGDYDGSERMIQRLLAEADRTIEPKEIGGIVGRGAQASPDLANLRSGESYVGYGHASHFVADRSVVRDMPSAYRAATYLPLNAWSLGGNWTVGREFAALNEADGKIRFRFHARDLHLVLGSAGEQPIRFRITIDGKPPGPDHGFDVDVNGVGTVQDERLYQLVRQGDRVTERTFEIEFLDPGVRAYAFTFG